MGPRLWLLQLRRDPALRNPMTPETKRQLSTAALIGGAFVLLALGGSFYTSRNMNKTADAQAMSEGRRGDSSPNLLQDQRPDQLAQGAASAPQTSTVPPL